MDDNWGFSLLLLQEQMLNIIMLLVTTSKTFVTTHFNKSNTINDRKYTYKHNLKCGKKNNVLFSLMI